MGKKYFEVTRLTMSGQDVSLVTSKNALQAIKTISEARRSKIVWTGKSCTGNLCAWLSDGSRITLQERFKG